MVHQGKKWFSGNGFPCENIYGGSCAVGLYASSFDVEIEAINQAVDKLFQLRLHKWSC